MGEFTPLAETVSTEASATMSPSIKELAGALAKAQGAIKGALKDSKNPHFQSRYADLASIWEACRGPLTENGLSVVQLPDRREQEIGVTTILLHTSGEWISGRAATVPGKMDPQAVGSATTYLRRYGLAAMVGVAPEDDDGEGAMDRKRNNGTMVSSDTHTAPVDVVSTEQWAELGLLLEKAAADEAKFCEFFKIKCLADMPAADFSRAKIALEAKAKANARAKEKKEAADAARK